MSLTLHILVLLIGAYIFYLTFVMRESTEGRWVNRIDEFWIRVDDRSKAAGDTTKSLFNALAVKVAAAFNRVVGVRIMSARLVGISGSLSFASAFFVFGALFESLAYFVTKYPQLWQGPASSAPNVHNSVPLFIWFGATLFLISGVLALVALLPVVFRSSFWAWLSCTPTFLVLFMFFRLLYLRRVNAMTLPLPVALAASVASDVLLLVIIRSSLKWMLANTKPLRMIGTIGIQALIFFIVFLFPLRLFFLNPNLNPRSSLSSAGFLFVIFNIPTAIASVSLLLPLLFVLVHRITWPALSQLTYILTRNDLLEKRKTLRTIAVGLIGFGVSGIPRMSFVLRLVQLLNK
jgi:hypothetical protein